MGKPTGKKKSQSGVEKPTKQNKTASSERASKLIDEDTAVFIQMAQELKEEGNKLFQKHDNEGAMLKYEKGVKLLPKNHIDVAYLRSKMAVCYMQLGLKEYPRAIEECNKALEVAPKYSPALVNRGKCYSVLNKFDSALSDVTTVLNMEPNNVAALEIESLVKKALGGDGSNKDVGVVESVEDKSKASKEKAKKKKDDEKASGANGSKGEDIRVVEYVDEKAKISKAEVKKENDDEKVVRVDKTSIKDEKLVTKTVKMVLGDDIRWAELPVNCSIGLVREIIRDRFPGLNGVLIKYKDPEGDLITVLTTDELRLAEKSSDPQGSFRLYLTEVSPDKEPLYEGLTLTGQRLPNSEPVQSSVSENVSSEKPEGVEEWIVQFTRLFKNHVGLDTNPYLDLHEIGMELYSEAMEDDVLNENAQNLFNIAGEKFKETSALAFFNWGNVHMNKARKLVSVAEDEVRDSVEKKVKVAYEWAIKEYIKAGKRYEESIKIKPDFYEGHLALGQQQFEQAKLTWHYTVRTKADLETPSIQILELYNKAEDNMEKGMQIWEELEERRLNGLSLYDKHKVELINAGLEGIIKDASSDEAAEEAVNIRSQIYILWGTLLYERSVTEFKLGLFSWEECLEVSIEKFELAGASQTDMTVIIKNHCSNGTALEGLNFKIDEIVQAWNEMFDTKRRPTGVPLFRLEPLFKRRVSKLHSLMENF
ncbi:putative 43kDa postsynaptic protein [Helianthus annuus]|uniref:43kDa postsynaptic protein n=2 Tax=Helianthus annuus TaxID=4232 RepID=A0A9K3EHT0_HELAN|nr:protein PHOX1 isoform X1 [Helianthus annuus]KAF5773432.1 putative 43kDa postsynaptic protein [Helianthus annuus]KAJ0481270.1 putative PB1 domain, tetratricopeptide-like helical domain superfamily [Helianthus annuus]KAJ0497746.1 putative PB1 domain, tetratricopeptide-like helical domain superfamily, protein PHOX1-4 [Helianthus annuus]